MSPSDWLKGIILSIAASLIGGAAKLAIRKSWLLEHNADHDSDHHQQMIDDDDEQQDLNNNNTPTDMESLRGSGDGNSSYQRTAPTTTLLSSSSTCCRCCCHPAPICLRLAGMFGMTFLNPLCGVVAMNYASPSILAPFSGLTLVWIVLCSHQLIGERPTQRQVIAAALIVLGEVIVAVFGDHTNDVGVSVKEVVSVYVSFVRRRLEYCCCATRVLRCGSCWYTLLVAIVKHSVPMCMEATLKMTHSSCWYLCDLTHTESILS